MEFEDDLPRPHENSAAVKNRQDGTRTIRCPENILPSERCVNWEQAGWACNNCSLEMISIGS